MSRAFARAALLLLLAPFLRLVLPFPAATAPLLPDEPHRQNLSDGGGGVGAVGHLPLILPLYSSNPKSFLWRQASAGDFPRRQLLGSNSKLHNASARMRLHDDLLRNGYYTTWLWIGTPPQKFALIVDTGSTVTYVPCSSCRKCGLHQDPRFKPELSSSYQPVKCGRNCMCDKEQEHCTYLRRYAEMSSSSGLLSVDIMSFGRESNLAPQRAVFGCETEETGDIYRQRADGIMGLGRGRLSLVDQLVGKGVIKDSFSLCYGGMDVGGGAMVLGTFPSPHDMAFSQSDPRRSPYYNIELKEIHVAGKSLQLNPEIFNGKHGTILDSGTTYAYLPEPAFVAFKHAVKKKVHHLKPIRGPDAHFNDVCFHGAGSDVSGLSKTFPEVDMVFSNGHKWKLSPENYLFRHTKVRGAYCLGIFQNGKDSATLLGGIVVRNTLVTYDRENRRIGFWKTNCSELWKNQQHAPVSPASVPANTTNRMPPPQVPSESPQVVPVSPASVPVNTTNGMPALQVPPQIVLPGKFQVGHIQFDMLLAFSNTSTKLNLTAFVEFMVLGLEVDASQVHILNFTSRGNEYLVRWAIYPTKSAYYISNSTAVNIILHLIEHHVQLPQNFKSYQLVAWNVEPAIKETWWARHLLAVFVGIIVVLVLVVSAFGVLFFWRRWQVFNAYFPVDGSVPEQELQPL